MFQRYLTCDHQAEQIAMEIRSISTFGVSTLDTVEFEENNYRILLRKVYFAFNDSKSQPGLFLRCS